jgi:hypothetical protein
MEEDRLEFTQAGLAAYHFGNQRTCLRDIYHWTLLLKFFPERPNVCLCAIECRYTSFVRFGRGIRLWPGFIGTHTLRPDKLLSVI